MIDGISSAFGKLAGQPKPAKQITQTNAEKHNLYTQRTILLVEDNSINQQVAREMLEELKLSVIIVNNGVDAL